MVATEVFQLEPRLKQIKYNEFLQGDRPDGSLIGTYRNLAYASDKARKNPLAGFPNVDLIDTGAFARSAKLYSPQKSLFKFRFTDSKAPDLLEKYNKGETGQQSIENISQTEFNKIQSEIIKPRFFKKIKEQIGQR